jgi:hypothetical protein
MMSNVAESEEKVESTKVWLLKHPAKAEGC